MPHRKAVWMLQVYIPYPLSALSSFSNINSYLFLVFFLSVYCIDDHFEFFPFLMFLCVHEFVVCSFVFPFFPIFLSSGFFPLATSADICILVSYLVFNTNSTSFMENHFVDGIVGMQVPPMCQESVVWIATSKFVELKTKLASSIRLHDTISFSLSSLLIYFPCLLGSLQKLLSFSYYLVNAPCSILFKKFVYA